MPTPHPTYTQALLAQVAAESRSVNEMMRRMGVPLAGGTHSYLSKRLRHYGIDTSHFTHSNSPAREHRCHDRDPTAAAVGREQLKRFGKLIPLDVLAPAVARSHNIKGLLHLLRLNYTGVTRELARRSLAEHRLDTSHFTGSGHLKGKASASRRSAEEVLRVYPPGSTRVSSKRLARALAESGLPHRCARCGLGDIWQGRALVLEIDHVNGDWLDNRLENLRILCPNCHTLTDTYCGRNRHRRPLEPRPIPLDEGGTVVAIR